MMIGIDVPELLILLAVGAVPLVGVAVVLFLVFRTRRDDETDLD